MVDTQRLQAADAILDQVVPAEAPWSGLRRQGQVLRIIDLGGQQAVDALFHAAGNPAERYSTQDTLLGLGVPYIGLGARLLSNEGRTMATLISPPVEVWRALQDMAVGGLYDDAFSRTLHLHLLGSLGRVYGGFLLAALAALPLGLLIGRVALVRQLLDPTFQVLRPIPVTAWLPLAMIPFGLGARSAFFLVFLGAFYPVLVNTIFGVRSVEPRLFEAAAMLGCQGSAQFFRVVLPARR